MERIRFVMPKKPVLSDKSYPEFVSQLVAMLERARRHSARSINSLMTATYWEIGRRIVEHEQRGQKRAQYGKALLRRLAADLTSRFGKGFSERNLLAMREFFLAWSIPQTVSAELREPRSTGDPQQNPQTASAKSGELTRPLPFPLPWSHYVRLLLSTTAQPVPSMKRKPCAAAGPCASSTGRSPPNSSNVPNYRGTRRHWSAEVSHLIPPEK